MSVDGGARWGLQHLLWTHLRFIGSSDPREMEVARSCIERSRSQSITFLVRTCLAYLKTAMDLLAPRSARWREANIWLPLNLPMPHSNITSKITNISLLESLSISASQVLEFINVFHVTPKFRNLSIRSMYEAHETWVLWNQLTSLDVGEVEIANCLETAKSSSNFLTLNIKSLRLVAWHPTNGNLCICLTFLTTLEICMTNGVGNSLDIFFDYCVFPIFHRSSTLPCAGFWKTRA